MKPSREQIIAWAREAGFPVSDAFQVVYIRQYQIQDELQRFAELAIASAGELEPVAWCDLTTWPKTAWPDDCFSDTPVEGWTPLYTHPNPATAGDVRKPIDFEALVEDLEYWSRYVEVDHAHQSLEAHIREVLKKHGITDKEQQS